ncbi:MAG TPA: hypothetical protein VHU82_00930 [Vicinamibacterales bacterium]|jgi:hypothetical protein|nr:hypothetical protein [Vicinamibacterales bacterium]
MHQLLHLLVVDHEGRAALADMHGTKWLLPMVSCSERTRAVSSIQRWIDQRRLTGALIGQWVGRLTIDAAAIDWLVVFRASAQVSRSSNQALCWIPLDRLRSSASVFDYQQWAVGMVSAGGSPRVAGPFGAFTWTEGVHAWLGAVVDGSPDDSRSVVYRAGAHEVVTCVPTATGPMYFKGLAHDRAVEAHVTSALAAAMPGSFARTRAAAPQDDGSLWWLAESCAGVPLAQRLTLENAECVAAACARTQSEALSLARLDAHLPRLDLRGAAAWGIELLRSAAHHSEGDSCSEAIAYACDEVDRAAAPCSWVPMDLDPANVLVDSHGAVRFIDLDDSYRGPSALAMATFARRVRRLDVERKVSVEALYRAYERSSSWSALGDRAWRAFEIMSDVLEARLGWERVVRNASRGELHGPLTPVAERLALRLVRGVNGQL